MKSILAVFCQVATVVAVYASDLLDKVTQRALCDEKALCDDANVALHAYFADCLGGRCVGRRSNPQLPGRALSCVSCLSSHRTTPRLSLFRSQLQSFNTISSSMADLKGKGKESEASAASASTAGPTAPASSTSGSSTKHATVAEDDDDDLDELDDVLE